MRTTAAEVLVGALISALLLAGCEKENRGGISDSEKRSRLIAMENADLRAQLERQKQEHEKQMQKQKDSYQRQLAQKQQMLDQCNQQKKTLEDMSKEGIEGYMSDILGPLVNENTKLHEQVKHLNARIAQLEAKVQNLEAEKQ